jgi:hypothetical protein
MPDSKSNEPSPDLLTSEMLKEIRETKAIREAFGATAGSAWLSWNPRYDCPFVVVSVYYKLQPLDNIAGYVIDEGERTAFVSPAMYKHMNGVVSPWGFKLPPVETEVVEALIASYEKKVD